MGRFLNAGNEAFAEFSRTRYFVDKSELINKLLEKDITEKFVCNSRARRFGKSVTADMLAAYFSKGADSRSLFEPLKCVKDDLFREFPCGKGFADIVYLPLPGHENRPVLVIELKWDKGAEAAIAQIKDRRYPESLRGYAGEIPLMGIDYDRKTKAHSCVIEPFRR